MNGPYLFFTEASGSADGGQRLVRWHIVALMARGAYSSLLVRLGIKSWFKLGFVLREGSLTSASDYVLHSHLKSRTVPMLCNVFTAFVAPKHTWANKLWLHERYRRWFHCSGPRFDDSSEKKNYLDNDNYGHRLILIIVMTISLWMCL